MFDSANFMHTGDSEVGGTQTDFSDHNEATQIQTKLYGGDNIDESLLLY